jgi:hypothetical protein
VGDLHNACGHARAAQDAWREALEIYHRVGDQQRAAQARTRLSGLPQRVSRRWLADREQAHEAVKWAGVADEAGSPAADRVMGSQSFHEQRVEGAS